MEEIWKPIPNYEGLYEVSNLGNVKSLSRKWVSGNGGKRSRDEIIMKPFVTGKFRNYYTLELSKDGIKKTFKVHQLVAIAFLNHTPNKYDGLLVDHIDGNKLNNHLSNLQLVTNRKNSSKDRKNKTSKFTGVSWHKQSNKWLAQVRKNNKVEYLGVFEKEEEAAIAYLNSLQAERMYSEEDMAEAFIACWKANVPDGIECKVSFNDWFEQFKKK